MNCFNAVYEVYYYDEYTKQDKHIYQCEKHFLRWKIFASSHDIPIRYNLCNKNILCVDCTRL